MAQLAEFMAAMLAGNNGCHWVMVIYVLELKYQHSAITGIKVEKDSVAVIANGKLTQSDMQKARKHDVTCRKFLSRILFKRNFNEEIN